MNADSLEKLLIECAIARTDISYSEALRSFGIRFSRPKMRELCRLLGEIDRRFQENGEPELAVLVVRSSDRLPGDGWWISRKKYHGEWTGDSARKYINRIQSSAFKYWSKRAEQNKIDGAA